MPFKRRNFIITCLALTMSPAAVALNIVTTTSNGAALVRQIAGPDGEVVSLTQPHLDPHYLEAKPSFMLMVAKADLLVSIGRGLESAWLPALLAGARHPEISPGGARYLELGDHIEPIEVPKGPVSRADGDVHPEGNPHFLLDPQRAALLATVVADRLGKIDPKKASFYKERADQWVKKIQSLVGVWQKQLKTGPQNVVTYHKTLNYFLDRFGLVPKAYIEPKPGVPPSPAHLIGLIKQIQKESIPLILVEHYFETDASRKIKASIPAIRVAQIPVSVGVIDGVDGLENLYEKLSAIITGRSEGL